jgi:hypothetical protein
MELLTVVACESLKSGREVVEATEKKERIDMYKIILNSFGDGIYHSGLLSLFCFVQ